MNQTFYIFLAYGIVFLSVIVTSLLLARQRANLHKTLFELEDSKQSNNTHEQKGSNRNPLSMEAY